MSKITALIAALSVLASVSVAQAGGKAEPIYEPEPMPAVIAAAPSSSGSVLPILLGLVLLGAVAAGSTNGSDHQN